jgi:hypothetical protein
MKEALGVKPSDWIYVGSTRCVVAQVYESPSEVKWSISTGTGPSTKTPSGVTITGSLNTAGLLVATRTNLSG